MNPIDPKLLVEVVRDGRASGGAYSLLEVRAPAGLKIPHTANRLAAGTLHVLEGTVEVAVDGLARVIEPGGHVDVIRGAAWRAHVLTDARLLWLGTPAGVEGLSSMLGDPPLGSDDAAALLAAAGVSRVRATW